MIEYEADKENTNTVTILRRGQSGVAMTMMYGDNNTGRKGWGCFTAYIMAYTAFSTLFGIIQIILLSAIAYGVWSDSVDLRHIDLDDWWFWLIIVFSFFIPWLAMSIIAIPIAIIVLLITNAVENIKKLFKRE